MWGPEIFNSQFQEFESIRILKSLQRPNLYQYQNMQAFSLHDF